MYSISKNIRRTFKYYIVIGKNYVNLQFKNKIILEPEMVKKCLK